jgi:hypothetical protein
MQKKKKFFLTLILLLSSTFSVMAFALPKETLNFFRLKSMFANKTENVETRLPKSETNGSSSLVKTSAKDDSNSANKNIPLQVTYLFLFRQLNAFEEKAKEAESKGNDGSRYRKLYQRLANLTDEQNALLMNIATDCSAEIEVKDEEARQLARQLHEQNLQNIKPGEIPPSSPELVELQKQHDEIILQCREKLKNGFGVDFERFEGFVNKHITSNITPDIRSKAASPPQNTDRLSQKEKENK